MVDSLEKMSERIGELRQYLPKRSGEGLAQILEYGEKIKAEGEKKKKEFWRKQDFCTLDYFKKLLNYKYKHRGELLGNYEYLDKMNDLERKKFVEEYLYDDILYSEGIEDLTEGKKYIYDDWKEGRVVMGDGVILDFPGHDIGVDFVEELVENLELADWVTLYFPGNQIGDEGANVLAKNIDLKVGTVLNLNSNQIGDEGAEAVSNMKLMKGVKLDLGWNDIGDAGVIAISNNLKLEEGVILDLSHNHIGDVGCNAIINNLELKEGVVLNLSRNNISDEMEQNLMEWEKSYYDRGINCKIIFEKS